MGTSPYISPGRDSAMTRFLSQLDASIADNSFVRLTISRPRLSKHEPLRLTVRPVIIRTEKQYSIVSKFSRKEVTKNRSLGPMLAFVRKSLAEKFLNAVLSTESGDVYLELGMKERLTVSRSKRPPASLMHDRTPNRWIDVYAPYLRELGVTDAQGKVRERMASKFRQIERFVDLLHSAFRESRLSKRDRSGNEVITLCDMGSGKGYLTFASYDYFRRTAMLTPKMVGIESQSSLVAFCNEIVARNALHGLNFVRSEIAGYNVSPTDILVALHACDTATDDAIAAGVRAGVEILLVAPCCHKEARPQVSANARCTPLRDVTRYGIFADRQSEMATDTLRALLLERSGYRVRIVEFVATEHTHKNILLVAVKRQGPVSESSQADFSERIGQLKDFYGIEKLRLESLLLG